MGPRLVGSNASTAAMPVVSSQCLLQGRAGRLGCTRRLPENPPSAQHGMRILVWDLMCARDVAGTTARCRVGAQHTAQGCGRGTRRQHSGRQAALVQCVYS